MGFKSLTETSVGINGDLTGIEESIQKNARTNPPKPLGCGGVKSGAMDQQRPSDTLLCNQSTLRHSVLSCNMFATGPEKNLANQRAGRQIVHEAQLLPAH